MGINVPAISLVTHDNRTGKKDTPYPVFFLPAYKTLGDEAYTDRLMKLNPQYRRTFVFPAGITLTVPEPETRVSSDLPPWKRGTAE